MSRRRLSRKNLSDRESPAQASLRDIGRQTGTAKQFDDTNSDDEPNHTISATMSNAGNHTHTVTGNTADSGNATVNETRVFSYGVTWIIKI